MYIAQHFYWKNLYKPVHSFCSKYKSRQFLKRNKKQYGKQPPKETESKFWDVLYIDLIGQCQFTPKGGDKRYQMTTKNRKSIYLQAVAMVDHFTGWIEILMTPPT